MIASKFALARLIVSIDLTYAWTARFYTYRIRWTWCTIKQTVVGDFFRRDWLEQPIGSFVWYLRTLGILKLLRNHFEPYLSGWKENFWTGKNQISQFVTSEIGACHPFYWTAQLVSFKTFEVTYLICLSTAMWVEFGIKKEMFSIFQPNYCFNISSVLPSIYSV